MDAFELRNGRKIPVRVYRRLGFDEEYWIPAKHAWFVYRPKIHQVTICQPDKFIVYYDHDDRELGVPVEDPVKARGDYISADDFDISWESANRQSGGGLIPRQS